MDGLATRWNSKLEADAVACEYRASKNEISNSARADSAKEAATDVPDLLNEPAGMQSPGERPDRMVKTEKLPTTAEAISKQLLTEVTSLLKKCRMRRFENVEGLVEAHEWQRLTRLFHRAGERYAMASFREGRSRLEWSRKNIESDGQSIHQQHAQHFCLLQSRRSDLGIDNVLRVFETKLDFAMSEAMCAAAVCIDGSELPSRTSVREGQSQAVARRPQMRKRSNQEQVRNAFMFLAIKHGFKGLSYCKFLHENKLSPPHNWISDSCPKSYPEAYLKKPWRQKIQDEKYRAAVKLQRMEQNEPKKLEKLLGIVRPTR